jgi:hypothetical protein
LEKRFGNVKEKGKRKKNKKKKKEGANLFARAVFSPASSLAAPCSPAAQQPAAVRARGG